MMSKPCYASVLLALAAAASVPLAHADIFTWTDKSGNVNVSNLSPPEDARVTSVTHDPPKDPAREAAILEARRQAEMRALGRTRGAAPGRARSARRASAGGLHSPARRVSTRHRLRTTPSSM